MAIAGMVETAAYRLPGQQMEADGWIEWGEVHKSNVLGTHSNNETDKAMNQPCMQTKRVHKKKHVHKKNNV